MVLPVTAETVDALVALVSELRARVAELERQLGLNSSNSSKPPSSDGPGVPGRRTQSLREKGRRKPGGQPGHVGRTLERVAHPDHVVEHRPAVCAGCQGLLHGQPAELSGSRQVFDLPEPAPLRVTDHRVYRCACAGCGHVTAGRFPPGVMGPVQYGPRLSAVVTYLSMAQFVPEDRLGQLMRDLFGVSLSAGTIGQMVRRGADRARGFAAEVCGQVREAAVKHLDETGFRVGARQQWLHVAGTSGPAGLAHYRISARRGAVLEGAANIVVHDHWTSYFQMPGVTHALCNAHHLRELTAAADIDGEAWAGRMRRLLRTLCRRVHQADGRNEAPPPPLVRRAEQLYDRIIQAGLAWHAALPALPRAIRRGRIRRRVGHNLLLRLQQHKAAVLLFLRNPAVPFTNNEAERDARMMKVRQKISGGFRTLKGAEDFAILRTLIGTANKRRWNLLDTLTLNQDQLVAKLRPA